MDHALVVDVRPDVRATMRIGLSEVGGFRVSEAASGEEALLLMADDLPHLAVVAMVLPGMSGVEFGHRAKACGVPVLLTTAEGLPDETPDALGFRHLCKPFDLDELLVKAKELVAESATLQLKARRLRTAFLAKAEAWRAAAQELKETRAQSRALLRRRLLPEKDK